MEDGELKSTDGLSISNGSSSSSGSNNSHMFNPYGSSVSSDDSNRTIENFSITIKEPGEINTRPPSQITIKEPEEINTRPPSQNEHIARTSPRFGMPRDKIDVETGKENRGFEMKLEDLTKVKPSPTTNEVNSSRTINKRCYFKQKCPSRIWILLGTICLCIIGLATWIFHNKYNLDFDNGNDPASSLQLPPIPGKCEDDISTVSVGEQICIPYTQKFTSSPSGIHVRQVSSQYFNALEMFSANVSSDSFVQQNGDWIINFNLSRTDQQFRFVKDKATCDNIGIYEITIDYDDGNVTSIEFETSLKDPQLQQSVTRINDSIHVHCEMTNTCKASSLALFVNDGESSRLIAEMNDCSNNNKKISSKISASAIIPVSRFSGNQTISCVPLMTDPELAANLTSTTGIPVCQGADCVPNCTNDPQGGAYYRDKYICNIFHQCSNGDIISQTCSPSTYWSHIECTCVHFDDDICDRKTYRFIQPVMSIEKCTNVPVV